MLRNRCEGEHARKGWRGKDGASHSQSLSLSIHIIPSHDLTLHLIQFTMYNTKLVVCYISISIINSHKDDSDWGGGGRAQR